MNTIDASNRDLQPTFSRTRTCIKYSFITAVALLAIGSVVVGALSYSGMGINVITEPYAILMMTVGGTAFVGTLFALIKRANPNKPCEQGFSSKKYFAVAIMAAIAGTALYQVSQVASIVFLSMAAWYTWSSFVIQANRIGSNSFLEKPIHLLYALAMEVNAGVACAALFPMTFFDRFLGPAGAKEGQPIVLVNGYLSFGSTFYALRSKLIEEGLGPIYTINIGSGRAIDTSAKHVQQLVEKIKKETGRNDIAMVCHSKGGLVSSQFASVYAPAMNVTVSKIVTIGSPFEGTPVAYIGFGYDAADMRPASPFTTALEDNLKKSNIRFHHIVSEIDEVVPAYKKRKHHFAVKDLGHLAMIFSTRVATSVCEALKVA